jgi:mersacidin/lichenicidin family type 2 lantibiotic
MTKIEIVRALKDASYRATLSEAARKLLPLSSAGIIELADEDLETFAAGRKTRETFSCTQTSGGGKCTCTCNAGRVVDVALNAPGAVA